MKKSALLLSTLFLIVITQFSCKKDSNSNNAGSNSSAKVLTSGTWTFQKYEYQRKDGTWIADPDAVDANRFNMSFNTNNTFNELDLSHNSSATGGWNFSADFSQITITDGEDYVAGIYTVNQLTSSLWVITNSNYVSGLYSAERLTFTR